MATINLLPWRVQQREALLLRFLKQAAATLFLVLTVSLVTYFYLQQKIAQQQRQHQRHDTQLQTHQNQLQLIRQQTQSLQELQHKLTILSRVQTGRYQALTLLNDLVIHTPADIVLTDIKQQEELFFLTGMAHSAETVSHYMQRLNEHPLFANVHLLTMQASSTTPQTQGIGLFEIKLRRLKRAEPQPPI